MAYKTVMTVLTPTGAASGAPHVLGALPAAISTARAFDAHLDVLAVGLDRMQIGLYYAGASAAIYQEAIDAAQKEAETLAEAARAALRIEEVRWGVDTAVAQIGGLPSLVGRRASFADLMVIDQPYGEDRGPEDEAVVEAALFDARVPVMVLPRGMTTTPDTSRIVIAWNDSPEALTAVRGALPLLQKADLVSITVVDPPPHGPERSDPGGMLSQMLARHGARCEVSVLARSVPKVSDVLMRHAQDINAGLMVMGAYGHSRFREAIMGGATRNALESATIPVLMAH